MCGYARLPLIMIFSVRAHAKKDGNEIRCCLAVCHVVSFVSTCDFSEAVSGRHNTLALLGGGSISSSCWVQLSCETSR